MTQTAINGVVWATKLNKANKHKQGKTGRVGTTRAMALERRYVTTRVGGTLLRCWLSADLLSGGRHSGVWGQTGGKAESYSLWRYEFVKEVWEERIKRTIDNLVLNSVSFDCNELCGSFIHQFVFKILLILWKQ